MELFSRCWHWFRYSWRIHNLVWVSRYLIAKVGNIKHIIFIHLIEKRGNPSLVARAQVASTGSDPGRVHEGGILNISKNVVKGNTNLFLLWNKTCLTSQDRSFPTIFCECDCDVRSYQKTFCVLYLVDAYFFQMVSILFDWKGTDACVSSLVLAFSQ